MSDTAWTGLTAARDEYGPNVLVPGTGTTSSLGRAAAVLDALDALGSPDAVADHLDRLGDRGCRYDSLFCPVGVHLRAITGVDHLVNARTWLRSPWPPGAVRHRTPPVVAAFVQGFDAGRYPALDLENPDPDHREPAPRGDQS